VQCVGLGVAEIMLSNLSKASYHYPLPITDFRLEFEHRNRSLGGRDHGQARGRRWGCLARGRGLLGGGSGLNRCMG
jgi:hypothetical protein